MNRFKNFSLVHLIAVVAVIALLAAMLIPATVPQAKAQFQYDSTATNELSRPLAPSKTLQAQYALGIQAVIVTNFPTGKVTNTFATNYTYSVPPIVIVTPITSSAASTNGNG